jgi:hypothetical protein
MKKILNFILLILFANYRSALAKMPSCEDYGYASEECGYGGGFFSDYIAVTALIIVSIVFIIKFLNSKEFRKNFFTFISGVGIIFISILFAQKYGEKIGAIVMGVIWIIYLDKFINWWFELFRNKNKGEQTTHLIKNKEQNKEQNKESEKVDSKKISTERLENYECQYCKNFYRLSSFLEGKNIHEIKCPNCLAVSNIESKVVDERNNQIIDNLAKHASKNEKDLLTKYINLCKIFNRLSPNDRYEQVLINTNLLESCEYRASEIPTLSEKNFRSVELIYKNKEEDSLITPQIALITFFLWRNLGTKYSEGLIEANWQIICDSADHTRDEYLENHKDFMLLTTPIEGYRYWIH